MSHQEHAQTATLHKAQVAVITCSDTRTQENDTSGEFIVQSIRESGHEIVSRVIVREDPGLLLHSLESAVRDGASIVLINGGTGLSKRDNTFEALSRVLESPLPGFGELFRSLSYEEIGAASMLSRAQAGRYSHAMVFSMPGSTPAVKLAMTKLILPQIGHIVSELTK